MRRQIGKNVTKDYELSDSLSSGTDDEFMVDLDENTQSEYALDTSSGRIKFRTLMVQMQVHHLRITKILLEMNQKEILKRYLISQKQSVIHVYILNCYNLASRDIGSESDPYLKCVLGNDEFNDRENYQDD
jgi:hypothetical protein